MGEVEMNYLTTNRPVSMLNEGNMNGKTAWNRIAYK
jgi:hypothetical protein